MNILLLFSAEAVMNAKREKAGWLAGMRVENYCFSDESKLEVAQHTYCQEVLGKCQVENRDLGAAQELPGQPATSWEKLMGKAEGKLEHFPNS